MLTYTCPHCGSEHQLIETQHSDGWTEGWHWVSLDPFVLPVKPKLTHCHGCQRALPAIVYSIVLDLTHTP